MTKPSYAPILDSVARDYVPDDVDLLPQIMARVAKKEPVHVNTKLKLIWTIVLVALGLGLATTVGYAIYRNFFDPGLQSIQESGLVTDLGTTAQPTILPELKRPTLAPHPATMLGLEQSVQGVDLRLEWVYLEETHLAFGFTVQGWAEGMQLGAPTVDFGATQVEQYRGGSLALQGAGATYRGVVVLNQLVREGADGGAVDLEIGLPLLQSAAGEETPLADFHFTLQGVPISAGRSLGSSNVYSASVDGKELALEFVSFTPQGVSAYLCQPAEQAEAGWQVQGVTAQTGDPAQMAGQTGVPQDGGAVYTDPTGASCERLHFPLAEVDPKATLQLSVASLTAGEQSLPGPWVFWVTSPDRSAVPGIVEPTPTPEPTRVSQTIGDLTATLQWAYADAQRVALQVHFAGWQEGWWVGDAQVTDVNGVPLQVGSQSLAQNDPADVVVILRIFDPSVLQTQSVHLGVDVPVLVPPDYQTPLASFHFDLDLPVYPETVVEPALQVNAHDVTMQLVRVQMTPSYTVLSLCYDKPSRGNDSDWGISADTTLLVDGVEGRLAGYGLVSDADYGLHGTKSGETTLPETGLARCVTLDFPVGHHATPVTVILSVPNLEKSRPEVISEADVQRANQILAPQGIQVNTFVVHGDGGGGGGMNILQKPDGMSDQEVYRLFYEALGYYYTGPWTFELTIQP